MIGRKLSWEDQRTKKHCAMWNEVGRQFAETMRGRDLSGVHVKIRHVRGVEHVEPKRCNISGGADNPETMNTSWMKQLDASRPYAVRPGRWGAGWRESDG